MKKLHSKIILTVVVLSVLIATIFSINMFASPSYTKVTFVHGGSTSSQAVASGESIILPKPEAKNGGEVYGWCDLIKNENSVLLHGYTSAQGDLGTRQAVADDINSRFGAGVTANNIYMTCGAAASLTIFQGDIPTLS